jgi:amino acid permease
VASAVADALTSLSAAMAAAAAAPPRQPPAPSSERGALLPLSISPAPSPSKPAGRDSCLAAAAHITAAVVGVGVLGLPRAVADLGWGGGLATLGAALALSLHTALLLARLPNAGATYAELAAPLGPRAAAATGAAQLVAAAGLSVAYAVTAGASAAALAPGGPALWTLLFGVAQVTAARETVARGPSEGGGEVEVGAWRAPARPLSPLPASQFPVAVLAPDFHDLAPVSAAGTAASCLYVCAAVVASARALADPARPPTPPILGSPSLLARVAAVGTVGFAFGGHFVVAGARAAMASPAKAPAAVASSYLFVAAAYGAVAVTGAASFGGSVADDVLLSPGAGPRGLAAAANAAVVLHVAAGLHLFSQPCFQAAAARLGPAAGRAAYLACVTAAAVALPFFGEVMALVGAALFLPATFCAPQLFHVAHRRAAGVATTFSDRLNLFSAAACALVSVAATGAAGVRLAVAAGACWGGGG